MKKIFILLVLSLISCSQYKTARNESMTKSIEAPNYKIYKIDSINNYYLIYAKKKDSLYKIVSKKENTEKCSLIKIGSEYPFLMHSLRDNAPTIGNIKIKPINYLDIKCFQFDNETKICKEDGIYDLYFADNIKGLCFIKK